MSSRKNVAVAVRGLSKSYTIAHEQQKESTLAETLLKRVRRPFHRPAKDTFWALRDLSFDIHRGDVVGIIGRNGAGKSTLLKILSRITQPTSGEIDLYGRVGSLLEVGTGFHPELTGRENIFLNGQILGMRKHEISRQFDAIVDFSGCEKFLDTPVKRYSSGMYVRLAFAVAAHLESEILIVDEVLAVGDAEFQRKCLGKMKDVASGGRTVIFVSHDIRTVRNLCNRAIYLQQGRIVEQGPVENVAATYITVADHAPFVLPIRKDELIVHQFNISQDSSHSSTFDGGKAFTIVVEFELYAGTTLFRLGVYLKTGFGDTIARSFTSDWMPDAENLPAGSYLARLTVPACFLMPGSYRLGLHASRYGIASIISEVDIEREITLLPPHDFNMAHPAEPINAIVMLKDGWKLERGVKR